MIETVEQSGWRDRAHLVAEVDRLEEWPASIDGLEPHFVLLVAADTSDLPPEPISTFAERLLAQGAVYICAWGPDCERVHDVFDETIVGRQLEGTMPVHDSALVITTWHADETLAEAVEYAVFSTSPAEEYEESCRAVLFLSVGNGAWAQEIRELLADPERLQARVDADEAARLAQEPDAHRSTARRALDRLIGRRPRASRRA